MVMSKEKKFLLLYVNEYMCGYVCTAKAFCFLLSFAAKE